MGMAMWRPRTHQNLRLATRPANTGFAPGPRKGARRGTSVAPTAAAARRPPLVVCARSSGILLRVAARGNVRTAGRLTTDPNLSYMHLSSPQYIGVPSSRSRKATSVDSKRKTYPCLPATAWWTLRKKFHQTIPPQVTPVYLADRARYAGEVSQSECAARFEGCWSNRGGRSDDSPGQPAGETTRPTQMSVAKSERNSIL